MCNYINPLILFTDASVNTQSKIGYGAYLAISDIYLPTSLLKTQVQLKMFEQTSSTKLELQTLLWALNNISASVERVDIYTDSQNITELYKRRTRLEKNNYISKKNKLLNNYKLYQEFYKITDQLHCKLFKVCGHMVSQKKDMIDNIFTLVDRASRNAMRNNIS